MSSKKKMITGSGGGKAGEEIFYRQPNTIRSTATARLLVALSAGPVAGLKTSDARNSILFDGAPLPDAPEGNDSTGLVEWEMNRGLETDGPIGLKGFNAVESTINVDSKLAHNAPWTLARQSGESRPDAAKITFSFPRGLVQRNDAGIFGTTVKLKIERAMTQTNGAYDWITVADELAISEKQTALFEMQYLVDLITPPKTTTSGGAAGASGSSGGTKVRVSPAVRVTRLTAEDPTDNDLVNQVNVRSVAWIHWDRLSYPGVSLLALRIGADSFAGRVPRLEVDIKGRLIKVPVNYTPATRAYAATWSGSFKMAFSNNPAWVLYDLLTDADWGLGIDEALIEKNDLYTIARYADASVPDGKGGNEPRFLFDGVIARRVPAAQLIGQICAGMRVSYFWSGGRMRFVQDRPSEPVLWLTNYHVEGGRFIYSGPSRDAAWSHALVSFNDTASASGVSVEAESNGDILRKFGYRAREVALLGCTRRSQARRHARWVLASSALALHGVSWYASLDHIAENPVRPGDVVRINDTARLTGDDIPGRILLATTDTITASLDMETTPAAVAAFLDYESSDGWKRGIAVNVTVATQDGRQVATITKQSGNWAHTPEDGGAVLLHRAATASEAAEAGRGGEDYRIIAVRERDNHRLEISAIRYDDAIYTAIENGLRIDDDANTGEVTGPIPPATGISIRQPTEAIAGNVGGRDIHVGWTAPGDPRIARWRLVATGPDGETARLEVHRPPAILSGLVAGAWQLKLTPLDWAGHEGGVATAGFTVNAVAPPSRGAVITKGSATARQWSDTIANTAIMDLTDSAPVPGDAVTLSFTDMDGDWAETRQFDGNTWVLAPRLISGDTLADGSVPASRLKVDDTTIEADETGEKLKIKDVSAGSIKGGSLRSDPYVEGESGFSINMNGEAEFNNATIRGELVSSKITGGILVVTYRLQRTQTRWEFQGTEEPVDAEHRFLTYDTPRLLWPENRIKGFEGTRVSPNAQNVLKLGELQVKWDSHTHRLKDKGRRIVASDDPQGDVMVNGVAEDNTYYSRFWSQEPVFVVRMRYKSKTVAQYKKDKKAIPWNRYAGQYTRMRVKITTTSGRVVAESPKIHIGKYIIGTNYKPVWKNAKNDATVGTILSQADNFRHGSVVTTTRTTTWENPRETGTARGRSFTSGIEVTARVGANLTHTLAKEERAAAVAARTTPLPAAPQQNEGFFIEFWFDYTDESLTHEAVQQFFRTATIEGTTLD